MLMLTNNTQRGLHQIAIQNGAYACFVKQFTSGEDLDERFSVPWHMWDDCLRKIYTGPSGSPIFGSVFHDRGPVYSSLCAPEFASFAAVGPLLAL